MATAVEIELVRLNIADEDSIDFTDTQIEYFIDLKSSVNYASYQLIMRLIPKLRKQLLEKDDTGEEIVALAPVRDRLNLLLSMRDMFKDEYESEKNNTTGKYIASTPPTIAGGDI